MIDSSPAPSAPPSTRMAASSPISSSSPPPPAPPQPAKQTKKFSPFSVDSLLSHREKSVSAGINNNHSKGKVEPTTPRAVVLPLMHQKQEVKEEEEEDASSEGRIDVCGNLSDDSDDCEDEEEAECKERKLIAPSALQPRFPGGIPIGPGPPLPGSSPLWPSPASAHPLIGPPAAAGIPWIAQFRTTPTGSELLAP